MFHVTIREACESSRRLAWLVCLLTTLLAALVATTSTSAQTLGAPTDLGTLGGDYSTAIDVNDAGQVVGYSGTTPGSDLPNRAFVWTPAGGMIDLGTLGGPSSRAHSINSSGSIAGQSDLTGTDTPHATMWPSGAGAQDLGTLGGTYSYGYGINDAGDVVGSAQTTGLEHHAFLWTATGGMVDLGTLGGDESWAYRINNAGHVVGESQTMAGDWHAFLWTAAGGMMDLGTLGGSASVAWGLNELGDVVGESALIGDMTGHAFRWTTAGGMVDLGPLGGDRSQAFAINDAGQVVGASRYLAVGDGMPWTWTESGGRVDLEGLGGTSSYPQGNSNAGHVVGESQPTGNPGRHAVLWTAEDVFAPTGLYASSIAGNTVTLRWTAPAAGLAPTDYVLEGGVNPGEVLASIPVGASNPIYTFAAPTGAFYVRMHTLAGAERSAASNEIRIFVNVPAAPSAPADLVGTANGSSIALAWRNTFEGGAPGGMVLDVSGSLATSLPLGMTDSFQFNGVPGGTYNLSLRAVNAAGSSPPSNAVDLTFPSPTCTGAPLPPANFLAYRVGSTIYVLWDPATTGPAPTAFVLNVSGSFIGSFGTAGRQLSGTVGPGSYDLNVAASNACGMSATTPTQTVVVQ